MTWEARLLDKYPILNAVKNALVLNKYERLWWYLVGWLTSVEDENDKRRVGTNQSSKS